MDPHSPLPARFQLRFDDGLELSWRWRPPGVPSMLVGLLAFLGCCPGSCGLLGKGLVQGTVEITREDQSVGYMRIPWLGYLLIAGSLLVTAASLVILLLSLVNRTTLRAGHQRLSIRHGPIALPGLELLASDILRIEPRLSRKARQWMEFKQRHPDPEDPAPAEDPASPEDFTGEHTVSVVNRQGEQRAVVSGLETEQQAAWLARELMLALGLLPPRRRGP
jgi:hypothetical protein